MNVYEVKAGIGVIAGNILRDPCLSTLRMMYYIKYTYLYFLHRTTSDLK